MAAFGESKYANLVVSREGAVARISLNRPDAKNALNHSLGV